MNLYHFEIGAAGLRVLIEVKARDTPHALAKLSELLNCPVIHSAWVGNPEGGKTRFPELRDRPLFRVPKESALFSPPRGGGPPPAILL